MPRSNQSKKPTKKPLFGAVGAAAEATFQDFGATAPVGARPIAAVPELSAAPVVETAAPPAPAPVSDITPPAKSTKTRKKAGQLASLAKPKKASTKTIAVDFDLPAYDELQSYRKQLNQAEIDIPLRLIVQQAVLNFIETNPVDTTE